MRNAVIGSFVGLLLAAGVFIACGGGGGAGGPQPVTAVAQTKVHVLRPLSGPVDLPAGEQSIDLGTWNFTPSDPSDVILGMESAFTIESLGPTGVTDPAFNLVGGAYVSLTRAVPNSWPFTISGGSFTANIVGGELVSSWHRAPATWRGTVVGGMAQGPTGPYQLSLNVNTAGASSDVRVHEVVVRIIVQEGVAVADPSPNFVPVP